MHFSYIISTYIIWKFFKNKKVTVSWQRHISDFSGITNICYCRIEYNLSHPSIFPEPAKHWAHRRCSVLMLHMCFWNCWITTKGNECTVPNANEMHRPRWRGHLWQIILEARFHKMYLVCVYIHTNIYIYIYVHKYIYIFIF